MNEMSKPILWEEIREKISFCRLLEFAHRVVKVIQVSADVCLFSVYLRYFVVFFCFFLCVFFSLIENMQYLFV